MVRTFLKLLMHQTSSEVNTYDVEGKCQSLNKAQYKDEVDNKTLLVKQCNVVQAT